MDQGEIRSELHSLDLMGYRRRVAPAEKGFRAEGPLQTHLGGFAGTDVVVHEESLAEPDKGNVADMVGVLEAAPHEGLRRNDEPKAGTHENVRGRGLQKPVTKLGVDYFCGLGGPVEARVARVFREARGERFRLVLAREA